MNSYNIRLTPYCKVRTVLANSEEEAIAKVGAIEERDSALIQMAKDFWRF